MNYLKRNKKKIFRGSKSNKRLNTTEFNIRMFGKLHKIKVIIIKLYVHERWNGYVVSVQ